MAKIIRIDMCSECPKSHKDIVCSVYRCYHFGLPDGERLQIINLADIPSWCPLEDAPEEKEPSIEKHLCDKCIHEFPTCPAKVIVWGIDRHPKARGAEADKVLECDQHKTSNEEPADYECCIICNIPFGNSLRYQIKGGWAHWHCIMNQPSTDKLRGNDER